MKGFFAYDVGVIMIKMLFVSCLVTSCINPQHDEDYFFLEAINENQQKIPSPINEPNDLKISEYWFSHQVQKGETLGQIARKYGVDLKSISKINKLKGHRIYYGHNLRIPKLSKQSSDNSDIREIWDSEYAQILAKESFLYGKKFNTKGSCLRGVRIALTKSLQQLGMFPENQRLFLGESAHFFKDWAINNVRELCDQYKLVPVTSKASYPIHPGLIYVYHKGRCGFSKKYGHVETVVSSEPAMVCSDNCRIIKNKGCEPDLILAPCKHCPREILTVSS